jgi:integrase
LLAYFRAHNEKFDKRVGVNRSGSTAKSYWIALKHVAQFISDKYHLSDIPFSALDRSFIDCYDLHLKIECKLAPGTIVQQTVRLGTIINKALADGIITADPFAGYEPERPERKPKYLTEQEVGKLITTPLKSSKHYLIRDLFLFSCYIGIPYGDMCGLTDKDLSTAEDGTVWIKKLRGKTGVEYEIPLQELPLQILERYRDLEPNGRLLPMYSNFILNGELKAIARTCGIDRPLTWHVARHTFSTWAVSQGVPIETVSRMLGHSRITTTQIYAKITDKKIDEDMRGLEQRITSKFKFAI